MADDLTPPDPRLAAVLTDLRAECAALDALVAPLDPVSWATPTPAPGWTVAHQIAHLAWTDESAYRAVADPEGFARAAAAVVGEGRVEGYVDAAAADGARLAAPDLLARWRAARDDLTQALAAATAGTKIPWFGPPMNAVSLATARLMETWAHGEDVAAALGVTREPSARLRHIAYLGTRTRAFSFAVRGLPAPDADVRVELTGPDGTLWTFGPDDAPERVSGPALDFCLLVTRRRHRDDLAVTADGPGADRWLDLAQAFAGPPGADPARTGTR
ncbi:MAG TPA: TIGR03084 family metal-binding protein [Mycobacteriales bacterium]